MNENKMNAMPQITLDLEEAEVPQLTLEVAEEKAIMDKISEDLKK